MTATALTDHAEMIARSLLGEPNGALSTKTQLRYGTNGSLTIEISGERAGTWFDHEDKVGGGMLDLIRREKGARTAKPSIGCARSASELKSSSGSRR